MRSKNVLIVDDDVSVQQSIGDVLELQGYHPLFAANGREALDVLRAQEVLPCVIVLDMMMPGMNGWQFLDHQRCDPALSEIPVIVCSSSLESARSTSRTVYVPKPVQLKQLVNAIQSLAV